MVLYALSGLAAMFLSAVLVEALGGNWRDVWTALVDGSLRRPGRWGLTIGVAVPMAVVAIGTVISTKAGLINIGQEGQMMIGGASAAYVGAHLQGPGPLVVFAAILFGFVGGGLWSGIAGLLRYLRNVPEVLTLSLIHI